MASVMAPTTRRASAVVPGSDPEGAAEGTGHEALVWMGNDGRPRRRGAPCRCVTCRRTGYEHDRLESFDEAVDFANEEGMYIAAFNHLTPFPGTPLYRRLQAEGRLRFDAWWLDPAYRYNALPFVPRGMRPEDVTEGCVRARRRFYSWPGILRRSRHHWRDAFVLRNFFLVNAMHRNEISSRNGHPLGDEAWQGPLLEVQ